VLPLLNKVLEFKYLSYLSVLFSVTVTRDLGVRELKLLGRKSVELMNVRDGTRKVKKPWCKGPLMVTNECDDRIKNLNSGGHTFMETL
jgi:hypothetical protein